MIPFKKDYLCARYLIEKFVQLLTDISLSCWFFTALFFKSDIFKLFSDVLWHQYVSFEEGNKHEHAGLALVKR